MSFFRDHAVLFALVCGLLAVAYGIGLTIWLLRLPAGNERMREIATRDPGRRLGLSAPPVPDDRSRRDRPVPPDRLLPPARLGHRDRLPDRRAAFRRGRVHRHERRGALEREDGRSGQARPQAGAQRRVPRRIGHRHARRRARPARRRGLLLGPDRLAGQLAGLGDRRPRRPRLRRLADLGLRASRRRHLHEGRGRRRRPGRQDRGGNPRGRSAQPGRDRGQRRRQRRRLRGHGRRPLRDLRRHGGGGHAARDARSRPASSGSTRWASAGSRSSPRSSARSSRGSGATARS